MAPADYGGTSGSITTSSTSSTDGTWRIWNNEITSSGTSTDGSIWFSWQASDSNQNESAVAESVKKKSEAIEKADVLLKENLDQDQLKEYEKHKSVTIKIDDGRQFRIRLGRVQNLDELDKNGNLIAKHCVHVRNQVPNPDNMLAQLLHLSTDPDKLLELANTQRIPVTV